jgi:EAL and modified HD-GYP domain-containing signal transduction protein
VQDAEIYVARQPIFDKKQNVYGYELLARNGRMNSFDEKDGDQATYNVIVNSFLMIGLDTLTNGKRAFINFTANSLKSEVSVMLPKELVAIEILESVIPDEEIIRTCKILKNEGYLLVLDDFVFSLGYIPLVELADIVKVDFKVTPREERWRIKQSLQDYPVKLLAEKVENQEEFQEALQMGYSYFQGYFFCKPVMVSRRNLPVYCGNLFRLFRESAQREVDFRRMEDIIEKDVSLTYKLLKFMNSPLFGFKQKIGSLRQAIALLGQKGIKKWIALMSLKEISGNKPEELFLQSLIRARFAQMLALEKMGEDRADAAFLMGLFSYIDVLLARPLQEILDEIALNEEIKLALIGRKRNQYFLLYKIVQSYEKGNWLGCSFYATELKIDEEKLVNAYRKSIIWAQDLLLLV